MRSRVPRASLGILLRDVGALQIVLAGVPAVSAVVALLYGEWFSAIGCIAAAAFEAGLGYALYRAFKNSGEPRPHHAMMIAAAGWLVTATIGALPFLITAYITPEDVMRELMPAGATYKSSFYLMRDPIHAWFESTSCYTTAGFTMVTHEPSIGHGLLFYRSFAVWIGGGGMIVLTLSIIPRPGSTVGMAMYRSEATGARLRPTIIGTARAIWRAYAIMTGAMVVWLVLATMVFRPDHGLANAIFDAINHAMAGVGTGGVTTLDDGIAEFKSAPLEMAHLLPMIVGMVSLPLAYTTLRERDPRILWRDPQIRLVVWFLALGTALTSVMLIGDPVVSQPIREGVFNFVSGMSTTGWQTSNIGGWNDGAMLIVTGAMFVGGSSGSTVGGVKLIRAYILFRAVGWRIKKVFYPADTIVPFKIGERMVPARDIQREISDAAEFTFIYAALLAVSVLITSRMIGPGFTLADSAFEVASVQSGTGLSTGIINPEMPAALEVTYILQMWIGRLEIFPVLVLLVGMFARFGTRGGKKS